MSCCTAGSAQVWDGSILLAGGSQVVADGGSGFCMNPCNSGTPKAGMTCCEHASTYSEPRSICLAVCACGMEAVRKTRGVE